jgi:hypothetical protein
MYHINKAGKKLLSQTEKKTDWENNLLPEIKELENEQQLMRIRNEQLSQDGRFQRELAVLDDEFK